jgi:hypothetical protein
MLIPDCENNTNVDIAKKYTKEKKVDSSQVILLLILNGCKFLAHGPSLNKMNSQNIFGWIQLDIADSDRTCLYRFYFDARRVKIILTFSDLSNESFANCHITFFAVLGVAARMYATV